MRGEKRYQGPVMVADMKTKGQPLSSRNETAGKGRPSLHRRYPSGYQQLPVSLVLEVVPEVC
jgi:hypothetical protein